MWGKELVDRTKQIAADKKITESQARREAFRQLANEQAKGGNG